MEALRRIDKGFGGPGRPERIRPGKGYEGLGRSVKAWE